MGHPSDRETTKAKTEETRHAANAADVAREKERLDEIERRLTRLEVDVVVIGRLVDRQEVDRKAKQPDDSS